MGPNVKKFAFWAIQGGPGWPINNPTGPILLPRQSSHLYQSTYKIWKQSDKDFLSYRENDEVSADAAADGGYNKYTACPIYLFRYAIYISNWSWIPVYRFKDWTYIFQDWWEKLHICSWIVVKCENETNDESPVYIYLKAQSETIYIKCKSKCALYYYSTLYYYYISNNFLHCTTIWQISFNWQLSMIDPPPHHDKTKLSRT